jgi:hypothetical protein
LGVQEGKIKLFGRTEISQERATGRITEFLDHIWSEGGWDGLELRITSDPSLSFSGSVVENLFLKAAYLAAFDALGFPYILASALEAVRQEMLEPETETLKGTLLVFFPQPTTDPHVALAYVHTPSALTSLAVFFLGYRLPQWCIVFLPIPACPGLPEYGRLERIVRDSGHLGFVRFDPSPDLLTDGNVVVVDEYGTERPIYGPSSH